VLEAHPHVAASLMDDSKGLGAGDDALAVGSTAEGQVAAGDGSAAPAPGSVAAGQVAAGQVANVAAVEAAAAPGTANLPVAPAQGVLALVAPTTPAVNYSTHPKDRFVGTNEAHMFWGLIAMAPVMSIKAHTFVVLSFSVFVNSLSGNG